MENIGYQLWSSDLAIGEDGNALVSNVLKSASIFIEEEINNAGGICGKKLKIIKGLCLIKDIRLRDAEVLFY